MIYATTNILEGYEIKEYLGVVAGEAIMGANAFKDFAAGIRDIVGGRSGSYEQELREAKRMLMVSVSGTAVIVQK
jgi:uncharacterized protein YbjQ (UPF0145 family)